jgi:tetratricopeptide (TPR) repeat protein
MKLIKKTTCKPFSGIFSFQKTFLISFFLSLVVSPYMAFPVNLDSLTGLLPGKQGIAKIELLNVLAAGSSEEFPEKSIAWSTEALNLSKKSGNRLQEEKALKNLGDAALSMANYPEAINYFQQSADIEEKLSGKKSHEFVDRMADVGYCYLMESQYENALRYFQQAADLAQQTGYFEEVANNYSNIATIYVEWGDYALATEYFQKVMDIDKKAGRTDKISNDLNNVGKMYELWGKFNQAIEYYQEALKIELKTGNKARIAVRLNNIGSALKAAGRYEEALYHFQQALEIERSLGNLEKVGKRFHHIGNTYFAMKQYDKCRTYLEQALAIYRKMDLKDDMARLYNSFGSYYLATGSTAKAIGMLEESQVMAKRNNLKPLQIDNFRLLARAYEQTGNYRQSLEAVKSMGMLKDSVFDQESDKKLTEFRARLENEKFKLDNERLHNEAEEQRKTNLLIGIALVSSLLILLAVVLILRLRARNARQAKKISEQKAEQYRNDLEIKNKELTYNAMCIVSNNETISRMIEKMEAALNTDKSSGDIEQVLHNIRGMELDHTWKEFEVRFTQVHKEFYDKLNNEFPDLTPNEKKLCAFLRLNMTTKDIASITHQSVHSINVARTRLRKKLNLANSEENLVNFFMKF